MVITPAQLARICPRCPDVAAWSAALSEAMREYAIESKQCAAHFLAQLSHESAEFTRLRENLNYSNPTRLVEVWRDRFWLPTPGQPCPAGKRDATEYVRAPRLLAEFVYGGRNGNRPEGSGDGWLYRGRGPIQLTGRGNYARAGDRLKLALLDNPDWVMDPDVGARVAADFWTAAALNALAENDDLTGITRRINRGQTGLTDRAAALARAKAALQ